MGIDWEELLGAEGEDMAYAYDDMVQDLDDDDNNPSLDCYYSAPVLDDGDNEVLDEDFPFLPDTYEGLCKWYHRREDDIQSLYGSLYQKNLILYQHLKDLRKLMASLKEHGIEIPDGIEERYQTLPAYGLCGEGDKYADFEVEKSVIAEVEHENDEYLKPIV